MSSTRLALAPMASSTRVTTSTARDFSAVTASGLVTAARKPFQTFLIMWFLSVRARHPVEPIEALVEAAIVVEDDVSALHDHETPPPVRGVRDRSLEFQLVPVRICRSH